MNGLKRIVNSSKDSRSSRRSLGSKPRKSEHCYGVVREVRINIEMDYIPPRQRRKSKGFYPLDLPKGRKNSISILHGSLPCRNI